jgi:hypothetical protein
MSPSEQPPPACETNAFGLGRFLKNAANKKAARREPLDVVFVQQPYSAACAVAG